VAKISDIAKRAGVSTATVSHVLNNTRYVSPELRARVERVAQELGYRPNLVARSLRLKRTRTLGFIVSDIRSPFYSEVARAVEEQASSFGYNVIVCNSDENYTRELASIETLISKRIDGLILAPTLGDHRFLKEVAKLWFPILLINRRLDGLGLPCISTDNRAGAYEAVRHLIQAGHRRIGAIGGLRALSTTADRLEGYQAALQEAGLPILEELIWLGRPTVEEGQRAAEKLLGLESPPTALFAFSTMLTLGVMATLKSRNLRCPEDVAFVGFSDTLWCSFTNPPLTTVAQPAREVGLKACQLLLEVLQGKPLPDETYLIPPTLIHRSSCGCPWRAGQEAMEP